MSDSNEERKKDFLRRFEVLSPLINSLQPLNIPGSGNVFNELVKNILYQQISYLAADTIFERLIQLLTTEQYTPDDILNFDFDTLKSVGLSKQKTQYIINISRFFKEKELYNFNWERLDDDSIIKLLSEIKGVGIWTVKMILIFELHREDVFPFEDLAIKQVTAELFGLDLKDKDINKKMKKLSEDWRPYRTLVTLYFWAYKRAQKAK